jgi:hypothetical protein
MMLDQQGITLAETLTAIALVGVGLAGLASVSPIASHSLQRGRDSAIATFLAEQGLERVRGASWVSAPARDCLGVSSDASGAPTTFTCSRAATPGGAACGPDTACSTFPDETTAGGFPGYIRTTRVRGCADASVCGDAAAGDAALRLVTVTVSYLPPAGPSEAGAFRALELSGLVARR